MSIRAYTAEIYLIRGAYVLICIAVKYRQYGNFRGGYEILCSKGAVRSLAQGPSHNTEPGSWGSYPFINKQIPVGGRFCTSDSSNRSKYGKSLRSGKSFS